MYWICSHSLLIVFCLFLSYTLIYKLYNWMNIFMCRLLGTTVTFFDGVGFGFPACVITIARPWVDFWPFWDEICASKLSATTSTKAFYCQSQLSLVFLSPWPLQQTFWNRHISWYGWCYPVGPSSCLLFCMMMDRKILYQAYPLQWKKYIYVINEFWLSLYPLQIKRLSATGNNFAVYQTPIFFISF